MSQGIVVDANIVAQFIHQHIIQSPGAAKRFIERAAVSHGLAVDDTLRIEQEWFSTCGSPYLKEWFVSKLYEKAIRRVTPTIADQHKKKLLNELGLPRKGYDLVCISTANATEIKYIVTEDMHFYDPKLKRADEKAKCRAREHRCGALCRYLRCSMGIRVGMLHHADNDLYPPSHCAAAPSE